MDTIGEPTQVWVTSRTTGRRESRGTVVIRDLRSIVTRTTTPDGPNGPNGPLTQYILAAAEQHLYGQLCCGLGGVDDRSNDCCPNADHEPADHQTGDREPTGHEPADHPADHEPGVLTRMLPLESFGPDVLDISRNNLHRRWATSADWLDDVIAFALRPDRALEHADAAATAAIGTVGKPFGDVMRLVVAGEVAAERDPARFRLAEIIGNIWPNHPAVRATRATFDESMLRWWVPFCARIIDAYGLATLPGIGLEDVARPLLTLVAGEVRGGDADGRAAAAILLVISGAVVDRETGARLTPAEIDARLTVSTSTAL